MTRRPRLRWQGDVMPSMPPALALTPWFGAGSNCWRTMQGFAAPWAPEALLTPRGAAPRLTANGNTGVSSLPGVGNLAPQGLTP